MQAMGIFFKTVQTFWILKTVDFQNQNLEAQKNMNFDNPRVLRKDWFHWTKFVEEVVCDVSIRTPQTNSKFC